MNDQKEVNLALRVAVAAAKSHTECAPETCGGSRYDECALGEALDALAAYQRSAGYIKPPVITAVDCTPEHGAGHPDCPKCWHRSERNPNRSYMSDDCANCAPLLAGASLTRVDGTDQRDGCGRCGFQGAQPDIWALRTWVDVRRGDVVRMPGQEPTAAEVMELATLGWHVNDRPPAQKEGEPDHDYAERVKAFNKDVQYRPNHHAGEWTARPVTLRPLAAGDPAARHRIPNVNPGAPVEIRCTRVDLDVIELLGGWSQRVA